MRAAGNLAARVLDGVTGLINPGVTTNTINDWCHEMILSNGAVPAPLNYKGFPKSVCTSPNNVVCHGIPDARELRDGDILNIDVTVILDGWFGDTSRMFFVGQPSIKRQKLCDAAYEAMMMGINTVKPGSTLGDIGHAIQSYAEALGYSVVREYTGHGIGRVFHTDPYVLNYGSPKTGLVLKEGMFFTVEPMLNTGKAGTVLNKTDGWTVTTRDMSDSAQFEHTIGVTEDGYEIFTLSPKLFAKPPYVA